MNRDILNRSSVYKAHGEYWCQIAEVDVSIQSREKIFGDLCESKDVLHVGCTDWPFTGTNGLHSRLDRCRSLDGVDTDEKGIALFRDHFEGHFFTSLKDVHKEYDILLVPEVLEHVDNAGDFLKDLNAVKAKQLIITVPDLHSCYEYNHFERIEGLFVEAVHPDHVAWYSPYTLKSIVERNSDFRVSSVTRINGRSIMAVCERVL